MLKEGRDVLKHDINMVKQASNVLIQASNILNISHSVTVMLRIQTASHYC